MKKIEVLAFAAFFLLTGAARAQASRVQNTNEIVCKADPVLPQGQGCCSWHAGECGCSPEGRDVCCDGSLSPSCSCHSEGIYSEAADSLLVRNSGSSRSYSGHVHVHGYSRGNGTYVAPHMRSGPDSTKLNNWSTKGNVNPYTGKVGTKSAY